MTDVGEDVTTTNASENLASAAGSGGDPDKAVKTEEAKVVEEENIGGKRKFNEGEQFPLTNNIPRTIERNSFF